MKPQIAAITIAVLALPIYAQDQPKSNTTTTTLSAPISVEPTDSPLVRAAKSTGRLGKKPGFVITNDTLLRVGASHMSISTSQGAPLPPPTTAKAPVIAPQQLQRTQPKPKSDIDVRPGLLSRSVATSTGTARPSRVMTILRCRSSRCSRRRPPQNRLSTEASYA